MKTVSRDEFAANIKKYFETHAKMSIAEAKKAIRNQMITDEWATYMKVGNVRLFYTDNDNYKQGKINNGGKGWYLTNGGFTGGSEIKLSKNF